MKRIGWLGCLGAVILLGSCGVEDRSEIGRNPAPSSVEPAQNSANPASQPVFNSPVLSVSNTAKAVPVPGLTPATNQEERLVTILRGRNDPFASISTAPIVVTTTSQNVQPVPIIPLTPPPSFPNPSLIIPLPGTLPSIPVTNLPKPSLTSLANGIEISGVMQVRGKLTAIVKVPEEPTSRYVSVGDYLGNGKVRVKRIELKPNQEPLVILEQNGVEVIKPVGAISGPVARTTTAAIAPAV